MLGFLTRTESFTGATPTCRLTRRFVQKRRAAETTRFFIAKDSDAEMVGFVHLLPSFDTLALLPMWILEDLFVASSHRRRGIASALLRYAENFARKTGAARLSLTTAITNEPAQRLYLSHGYQRDELFWMYHRMLT